MGSDDAFFRRQGALMVSGLGQFQRGETTLNALTNHLDGLWWAASDYDPEWRAEFRRAWAVLEEVNAVQLDEGHRAPTNLEQRLTSEALGKIESLAFQLSKPIP